MSIGLLSDLGPLRPKVLFLSPLQDLSYSTVGLRDSSDWGVQ